MKALRLSLLTLVAALTTSIGTASAQTAHYLHKIFSREGCQAEYSVAKDDTAFYIVASITSEGLSFMQRPRMRIRTFNSETLTLDGQTMTERSQTGMLVMPLAGMSLALPYTEHTSVALFPATPEQFETLKSGVQKVKLDMMPVDHEKTFRRDRIGQKLYQLFLIRQNDDF